MLKERLKGVVIGVLATVLLLAAVPVFASSSSRTTNLSVTFRGIQVSVDGELIVTEREPFIYANRTYLSVRDVAKAFGAEIRMNEPTNTLEIITNPEPPVPAPTPAPANVSATNRNQRPPNPTITRERAEQIAIEWLRASGITGTRRDGGVSMDFEYGRWVWELEHENRTYEWDFYIDVMTGEVVSVERDRR